MKKYLPFLLIILSLLTIQAAHAANNGDYRTTNSGDWGNPAIWQRFNGSTWVAAIAAPNFNDGVITILAGDSVVVNNLVDSTIVDQVTVNAGGILNIVTTKFFINNGAGKDLTVKGKFMVDFNANVNNIFNDDGRPSIDYRGESLIQNGGLVVDITFDGTTPQAIFGTGYFGNIWVNNSNNLTIKNGNSFSQTTFIKGKILVEGVFVISQYSNPFVGAGPTKYIEGGSILFITYTPEVLSFTLPIGVDGRYLPVTFTAQKNDEVETHYSLTYVNSVPPSLNLPDIFDRTVGGRYLHVMSDHPENLVNASIQMSYDAWDAVVAANRLRIVKGDETDWVNVGGSGNNSPAGKITSSVNFNTLGIFAFANTKTTTLRLNSSVSSANMDFPDVYKLTTTADGRLRFKLTSKNTNAINLQLLDGDSATILGNMDVAGNTAGTLVKDGLAKGIYYVKLTPADMMMTYSYLLADSIFVPAWGTNIEPDSTRALAHNLIINGQTTGHVGYYYMNHRDTADWFKLTTNGDGLVKVFLQSGNSNNLTAKLFDNDGVTLLASANVKNVPTTLSKDGLAAGTYYIQITGASSDLFAPYSLGDSLIVPMQTNINEKDSTKALARAFALNSMATGHIGYYYNNHRDTFDWYKITTSAVATLKLNLTSANANAVALTLYDNTGTTSLGTFNALGNSTNSMTKANLPASTYYVVVRSTNNTKFAPYIVENIYTPNGGFAASVTGAEDILGKKELTDAEVLPYPNPAAKQLRIQYNGLASGSVAVTLKDMNGKTVWSSAKTNAGSLNSISIDVSRMPAGTYYLQIIGDDKKVITKKVIIAR